jgi:LPXTG-motif cell wall-anchored protein
MSTSRAESGSPRRLGPPAAPVLMVSATVALPACDLLPQTSGEWTVALVIAGVLVVGIAVMAWVTSRTPKK